MARARRGAYVDVSKALRTVPRVLRDADPTIAGSTLVGALSGRSWERFFDRFAHEPMGAKILAERRCLPSTLADRDSLSKLPEVSLGRQYLDWTERERISIEGLVELATYALPSGIRPTPDQKRFWDRDAVAHDLWHVVTGYGRDLLGEAALLHVMWIQTGNRGFLLPAALSVLEHGASSEGRRVLREARRLARSAAWLPAQDWETLLPQRLSIVREALRIPRAASYEPVPDRRRAARRANAKS